MLRQRSSPWPDHWEAPLRPLAGHWPHRPIRGTANMPLAKAVAIKPDAGRLEALVTATVGRGVVENARMPRKAANRAPTTRVVAGNGTAWYGQATLTNQSTPARTVSCARIISMPGSRSATVYGTQKFPRRHIFLRTPGDKPKGPRSVVQVGNSSLPWVSSIVNSGVEKAAEMRPDVDGIR